MTVEGEVVLSCEVELTCEVVLSCEVQLHTMNIITSGATHHEYHYKWSYAP